MAEEIQIDEFGGEYKIVDGELMSAVWVSVSAEEKKAMVEKAKAENINLRLMLTNVLREWVSAKEELGVDDLEKVAGGVGRVGASFNILNIARSPASRFDPRSLGMQSTVMCPW